VNRFAAGFEAVSRSQDRIVRGNVNTEFANRELPGDWRI
jgi:hypothetical protein